MRTWPAHRQRRLPSPPSSFGRIPSRSHVLPFPGHRCFAPSPVFARLESPPPLLSPPLPACATSVSSICRGTSIARHALSGCPLRARSHRTSTYRSSHGSCSSSQSCVHSSVRFTPEPLATLRPETRPRPTVRVQFPSRRRARPATWSRSGVGGTALYLRDDIAPFTHSVEHRQSGTLRSSVASAVPSSVPACTRYTLIRIHCCSHTQSLDLSTQSHLTPSGPGEHHNHILFGIPVRLPRRARAAHTRAPGPNARCCLLLHRASRHYQLISPLSSPSRCKYPHWAQCACRCVCLVHQCLLFGRAH